MRLKEGDYIKYYKPKAISRLFGQILEETDKHYRIKILGSSIPGQVNKTCIFQKNGKIINFVTKVNKEDVIYGMIKRREI